jgi:hypothetical protein
VDALEQTIQAGLGKISSAMSIFRRWAVARRLNPSETAYVRHGRGAAQPLRFSVSGDPEIERAYRTHYVSPALSEQKQRRLNQKLSQAVERVVFDIVRESQCSECGAELARGSFLFMDGGQPLCLPCADLDELEYLPRGDAAVTRRAAKYSPKTAVVVRFSRSRGRYERQGLLVDPDALKRAEEECTGDAAERAAMREVSARRRAAEDQKLVAAMADAIRALFPACPTKDAQAIAVHTATRGSGRVGRTAAGRELDPKALLLAVQAAVRHRHTDYDEMLGSGLDRELARARVRDRVEEILQTWRSPGI